MVTEGDLMKLKVPELRQKLLELGITPRGLKADLVKQLADAMNQIDMQQQQQQQQFQQFSAAQVLPPQQTINQIHHHHQQQQQQQQILLFPHQEYQQIPQQQEQFVPFVSQIQIQQPIPQQSQQQIYIVHQQQPQQQQQTAQRTVIVQQPVQEIQQQQQYQQMIEIQQQQQQQTNEIQQQQIQQESLEMIENVNDQQSISPKPPSPLQESNQESIKQQEFQSSAVNNETISFDNDDIQQSTNEDNIQQEQQSSNEDIQQEQTTNDDIQQKQQSNIDDIQQEQTTNDDIQHQQTTNDDIQQEQQSTIDDIQHQQTTNDDIQQEQQPTIDDIQQEPQSTNQSEPVMINDDDESKDMVNDKNQDNEKQEKITNEIDNEQEHQQHEETINSNDNNELKNVETNENENQQQKQSNEVLIEDDDNDNVDEQKQFLLAINMSEDEWMKLTKNQRRKLKKKYRNKIKRKERDAIERKRQEELRKQREKLEVERKRKQEIEMAIEEAIKNDDEDDDDDDRMDIDEEDAPEEEKERKRLEELERRRQEQLARQRKLEESKEFEKENENKNEIEIEYIPEDMPKDSVYLQFLKVFDKFSAVSSDEAKRLEQERLSQESKHRKDDRAKLLELKKPVELELKDDDDRDGESGKKLSKRRLKQLTRMSVADLKRQVKHPELVEMHDVTAKDPLILLYLKSTKNTVPVPRHWCYKRKYLQGKRGFEKPPFKLPEFIRRTGIQEMREAIIEKEDAKSLKTKMKEKIRPKMGKIDIDYQKLHDAFFKWQTKPKVTIHGDLYYEGKEFETRLKDKKPGDLTNELRQALGMPTGPNANKCPPPWLIAMQRYGPPPSYPNIKIPGLNAPIPEGCCFGYHAGGWGKPPVDEYGRPLYGDVFGITSSVTDNIQPEEEIDRTHWGEIESDEEEEEDEDEDVDEEGEKKDAEDQSGLVTPSVNAEGLATPSGISTGIPSGLETPDMIELRKRKQQIEAEMESGDQQQLFTVIPEKKVERFAKDMMGSMHVYDFASLSKTTSTTKSSSNNGVDVALDPSELESGIELDSSTMAAKYEQTLRETSGSKNPHEDLSDMVAEHASKQKRRKQEHQKQQSETSSGSSTSKSSKKYHFKF